MVQSGGDTPFVPVSLDGGRSFGLKVYRAINTYRLYYDTIIHK